MKSLGILLTACTCLVHCLPPPHPDVLALREAEELLPPLLRSPASRNSNLLKILPLTSLLHEGEKLVFEREANNVSRREIYNILTHAGFIPRNAYPPSSEPIGHKHKQISVIFPKGQLGFHDSSYFPSQDSLQYL